ncbi:DUF6088 family protein [Runella sp. SP2]|uniref:DUF6088 family protein n=1 Tax=Runella sp. SP2 TaxID=2268026 RepID=UPI000F07488C|nr:DUF6088 family protein [Runella sp. SP2]AYQ36581.1 hypothetical protein DTQ70_30125 [Runella sp. SP2]
MKTTTYLLSVIDRLPKGYVFSYTDFEVETTKKEAVIKALNRMVQSGKLRKLSKGKFYKPETSIFGQLQPKQLQIVKDLLEEQGKLIGYLTGYSVFPQLGLTTQVSNTLQIGRADSRPTFKRERYTISFIKQKNTITKENIPLLQLLDALRYIKKIPDTTLDASIRRFLALLKDFSDTDFKKITRLALKYPPSTRALLGALLDELNKEEFTKSLFESLNPITTYTYSLGGSLEVLNTTKKWNIQ